MSGPKSQLPDDPSDEHMIADAGRNTLPLDNAPRIVLSPGVEGRYGLCPVSTPLPNPNAVSVHPKRQIDKLSRSMKVIGPLAPLILDENFVILAGHARIRAAKQSGATILPVIQVFGLSEAQKRAYLLADNQSTNEAKLDREKFAAQIPDLTILLEQGHLQLTDTCFEMTELEEIVVDFEESGPNPADDIDPTLSADAIVLRQGDIVQLGSHRLAVGDARDPALLDELMHTEEADAAFLDVPYNVSVDSIGGRGKIKHAEFAFASGEMSDNEFESFLTASLSNAARKSKATAIHFVCIDWKHVHNLISAGKNSYRRQLNLIVWNKTNAGQGGLYRNQHELISVFVVGEGRFVDNVQQGRFGRNRSNVWTYAGANTFRSGRMEDLALHPTVKPVQLVADALKDVTNLHGIVLDTFVGSGTTILAGEKVGRHVRAVEIEPRYAQIAVRRWERLTGKAAVHEATKLTFDELIKKRTETVRLNQSNLETVASIEPPLPRVRIRPKSL